MVNTLSETNPNSHKEFFPPIIYREREIVCSEEERKQKIKDLPQITGVCPPSLLQSHLFGLCLQFSPQSERLRQPDAAEVSSEGQEPGDG